MKVWNTFWEQLVQTDLCLTRSRKADCCFAACSLGRATEMPTKRGVVSKASPSRWQPCRQRTNPISHSSPVSALPKHGLISTLGGETNCTGLVKQEDSASLCSDSWERLRNFIFFGSYQQLQVSNTLLLGFSDALLHIVGHPATNLC